MTAGLKRRLSKAGFNERLDARTVPPDSLGISELCGKVDFTSVFAMVHEISSSSDFFAQASAATKTGGELLLVEPSGHVKTEEFNRELADAAETRFEVVERPVIRRSCGLCCAGASELKA